MYNIKLPEMGGWGETAPNAVL